MATYDNSYQMKVTPNQPGIRGISDNYDNSGQVNQGGYGLGDIYQLDYDRNKIEQIFNQGTDAQYALMQKENQIAQNQYANNQFANQQSAIETLRQQRNNQIASGMARGLNAAQEQGTVLGLQQEAASGALELANQQQLEADKIAAEYANNVSKALQESNSVKQAMAQVAAQMYEADMLGYTGELSYMGQMDANASDRYGYDLGYEGTKYSADKNYDATVYNANKNYEGTVYAADRNLEGQRAQAAATRAAAATTAAATKYAADLQSKGVDYRGIIDKNTKDGVTDWEAVKGDLIGNGIAAETVTDLIADTKTSSNKQQKGITIISNTDQWIKALDGNNEAIESLGLDPVNNISGHYRNADVRAVIAEAQRRINNGDYIYTDPNKLILDMKKGEFGALRTGF